jgi:hypothetical protein
MRAASPKEHVERSFFIEVDLSWQRNRNLLGPQNGPRTTKTL